MAALEGEYDYTTLAIDAKTVVFVSLAGVLSIIILAVSYSVHAKNRKKFWHHAIRLPHDMRQPYWYLISLSTGCRPWAGHEGDVFLRLEGSRGDSKTFIINGGVHPRLWEADSHLYVYSSAWPLGEINRISLICRPSARKKLWYLASVQIKLVTSNLERLTTWYFPYHEWIEVFQVPVVLTLSASVSGHDLNRRLMIGWLGRGISDLHLWTSIFTPLKYTTFGRSERVLCISMEILGSIISCLLLNTIMPQMSLMVLGLCSASCAVIPVSIFEAILRRVQWKQKILIEDVKWYKVTEDGFGLIERPKTYRQYILKPTHKKMNFDLMFHTPSKGKAKKSVLKELVKDRNKFWNWLDPSIPLPEPEKAIEMISSKPSLPAIYDDPASEEEVEEEDVDYTDDERTWIEKLIPKIKNFFSMKRVEQDVEESPSFMIESPEIVASMIIPLQTEVQTAAVQYAFEDETDVTYIPRSLSPDPTSTEDSTTEEEPSLTKHPILQVGNGYIVKPVSVWKVDSTFSIGSFNTATNGLGDFKTMESMPAAEFEGLKSRKENLRMSHFTPSELKVRKVFAAKRRGAIGNIAGRNYNDNSMPTDIVVPSEIEEMTEPEILLVSWIFHDCCMNGNEWIKKDTSSATLLPKHRDPAAGRNELTEIFSSRHDIHTKEPVPRERVFDMLIFSEYADKITLAFIEMITQPEAWSVEADFIAEWAECRDGPIVFSEACILVSTAHKGEKIVQDIIACAKSSPVWPILICELTRRLRYQGDNVTRLKEKYGLDARGNGGITKPGNNTNSSSRRHLSDTPSESKVFDELQLLLEWRQKLHDLEIPLKNCPMKELQDEELKVLKRFYRSMLKTAQGCYLFGELLRQVIVADEKGRSMVCRVMRYTAGHRNGVPSVNQLFRGIVLSGVDGRTILIKIFSMVNARQPNGPRIIQKLANVIDKSEAGRLVLNDLQVDASRAHRQANDVRQEINRHLFPIVQACKKNFSQLVFSLNDLAKIMLRLADNAREVIELSEDSLPDVEGMQKYLKSPAKQQYSKSEHRWNSERICCRRDQIPTEPPKPEQTKPDSNESLIALSDGVEFPAFVMRDFRLDTRDIAVRFKNLDDGDKLISKPPINRGIMSGHNTKACHDYNPCEKRRLRNLNEFFLQSKDFERFNIDFKYQKRYRDLETNTHHDTNHDNSRCWEPTPQNHLSPISPYAIPGVAKESCVVWKDSHRADPDNWGNLKLCTCHGQFLGDQGNQDALVLNSRLNKHSCAICTMASDLEKKDCDDIFDVVSTRCGDTEIFDVSDLKGLPTVEKDTVKNIQRRFHNLKKSEKNHSSQNDGGNVTPFPSGYGGIENRSGKNLKKSDETYPYCGTPKKNVCECIDGKKEKDSNPVRKEPPHLSNNTENETEYQKHSCRCKMKNPATGQPDTALKRRDESKNFKSDEKSHSKRQQQISPATNDIVAMNQYGDKMRQSRRRQQIPTTTKDYEFPVVPQTSAEKLSHLTRKFDPKYWDDSDKSTFSDPPPNYQYICGECDGVTKYQPRQDSKNATAVYQGQADIQRTHYLSPTGALPRNSDSIEALSSHRKNVDNLTEKSSKESWKSAMGCCNSPGCYGLSPRNTHYRHSAGKDVKNLVEFSKNERNGMVEENDVRKSEPSERYQYVNSHGKLTNPAAKTPLIRKFHYSKNMDGVFEKICDLCKFPKFQCCDDDEKMHHQSDKLYCKCKNSPVAAAKAESIGSSVTNLHSTCSRCHIRVGTQQVPPESRYLLPLKIMRCYENTVAKFKGNVTDMTDSGTSLHTAIDIMDDSNDVSVNDDEKLVILDLLGLSGKKSIKKIHKTCKPKKDVSDVSDACSDCSSLSSGICCHVKTSRLRPVLHLQGFTCQRSNEVNQKLKPLGFKWWQRHEVAMKSMQACADDCVSLSVILAKDKGTYKTEHEATCKVCTSTDPKDVGIGDWAPLQRRYSECLPVIWRPAICSKTSNRNSDFAERRSRPRFYLELIDSIVKSTKTLLLTPDLQPTKLKRNSMIHRHFFGDTNPSDATSELDVNDGMDETHLTMVSAERLSHFRTVMKCLNDIQCQGAVLQSLRLVSDKDVTMAALLERQGRDDEDDETEKLSKDSKQTPTFIDLILDFMKKNSCGAVLDCVEVLEAPWELPVEQQQLTAHLLQKIDSTIHGKEENRKKPKSEDAVWEETLGCIIDSYLNEIAFKSIAQRDIGIAIEKSNLAQWYLLELADIARLTIARIVRFAEMTQAATANLKEAVKDGLCDASSRNLRSSDKVKRKPSAVFFPKSQEYSASEDEYSDVKRHITALLKTGRDDTRATLDDVLISFERLRYNIYCDLEEAANLIKLTSDLADEETLGLQKTGITDPIVDEFEKSNRLKEGFYTKAESLSCDSEISQHGKQGQKRYTTYNQIYPNDKGARLKRKDPNLQPRAGPAQDLTPTSSSYDVECNTSSPKLLLNHDQISQDYPKCPDPSGFPQNSKQSNEKPRVKKNIQFLRDKVFAGRDEQRILPQHFHDVFHIKSETEFEQEDHTRKALQADKGKGMLQYIFENKMTELEMVEAFHSNIKTLLSWQNSIIGCFFGDIFRFLLLLAVVSCCAGACLMPIYYPPTDYTTLWSVLLAIFSCIVVLEPSKCIVVSWFMFMRRVWPAFYSNPIYLKSNPSLVEKSAIFQPYFCDDLKTIENESSRVKVSKPARELYGRYYKNRTSTKLFDRRRRVLPIVIDSDLPIDISTAHSSISNLEVKFCDASDVYESDTESSESNCDSKSFGEHTSSDDINRCKESVTKEDQLDEVKVESLSFPLTSVPVKISATAQQEASSTTVESVSCDVSSESLLEETKHTPFIYCRYSNFPK